MGPIPFGGEGGVAGPGAYIYILYYIYCILYISRYWRIWRGQTGHFRNLASEFGVFEDPGRLHRSWTQISCCSKQSSQDVWAEEPPGVPNSLRPEAHLVG